MAKRSRIITSWKGKVRSTVFRFQSNQEDPKQIGQTLQVNAVLMGRITRHGDQLGVQASKLMQRLGLPE